MFKEIFMVILLVTIVVLLIDLGLYLKNNRNKTKVRFQENAGHIENVAFPILSYKVDHSNIEIKTADQNSKKKQK